MKIVILSALIKKLWSKTSFCTMTENVTRSRMSHVQTAQNIDWKNRTQAVLWKCLATLCPLITEIWPKMWFWKGHDLERSRSQVKTNDTIWFHDLKYIELDAKIIILNALVKKLRSKTCFSIMVANVRRSHPSHVQTVFYKFIERPQPKLVYLVQGGYSLSAYVTFTPAFTAIQCCVSV